MFVKPEEIYAATNGGLDVILQFLPQAGESAQNPAKKFKFRTSEKTASASLKKSADGVWIVTDFGGDQKPRNCIELVRFLENLDFKEAVQLIATRFNVVPDTQFSAINKAEITKRDATVEEVDKEYFFDKKDKLDDWELKILFAEKVIEMHYQNWEVALNNVCTKANVYSLRSFTQIKDRKAITTSATDRYPIFVIEGEGFKKIYQPLNDKQFRFRYTGDKPKNYVFGLKRLEKEFNALLNKDIDKPLEEDPEKKKKQMQLDHVIICSGDRDSLNVMALGYTVIWQNSESAPLEWDTYKKLRSMCKEVYNLPDIDSTGKRQAHKMAMDFLDIRTIELPDFLLNLRDWRGNPCKDVRDYLKVHGKKAFDNLVKTALPYRFWDVEPKHDKEGNFVKFAYMPNNVHVYNFLQKNGFARLKFANEKEGYVYVQVNNYMVKRLKANDVKGFINRFLQDRNQEVALRNSFYRSNQLNEASLSNLGEREIDFTDCDRNSQFMFFMNKAWKITSTGIDEFIKEDINKFVWEEEVIQHRVTKKDPSFTITKTGADGILDYDIEIHNTNCTFFKYLINTSRLHWQKEFETSWTSDQEEERLKYIEENRYNIAGPRLSAAEIKEQKLHLINKIWVFGYLAHHHKDKSNALAVWAMDAKLSEEGESHGGSGKSLGFGALKEIMPVVFLPGRNPKLTENPHMYDEVSEHTDLIIIDDCNRWFKFEAFFSDITNDLKVNPKHSKAFTIPFKDAPKIVFTSNFGLNSIDPSTSRRIVYTAFSDFYHNNASGEYKRAFSPKDDFGKTLFADFKEDEWNCFFNTLAQCCRWYMNFEKIDPPLNNVTLRNLQTEMGSAFQEWADVYFSEQSDHRDELVQKNIAFEDFKKISGSKLFSSQRFSKCMTAWCKFNGFILNPKNLQNGQERIIRRVPEFNYDNTPTGKTKSVEMIYIMTRDTISEEALKDVEAKALTVADQTLDMFTKKDNNDDLPF